MNLTYEDVKPKCYVTVALVSNTVQNTGDTFCNHSDRCVLQPMETH